MIIGIDPGSKGGVAFIHEKGTLERAFPMPSGVNFFLILHEFLKRGDIVWIEKAAPRHTDGNQSIFTNGVNYGRYITSLEIINELPDYEGDVRRIHIEQIPPITWKTAFGLSKDKKESMAACLDVYPESKKYIYGSQGGMKDGVAEAILIAHYGYLHFKRQLKTLDEIRVTIKNGR